MVAVSILSIAVVALFQLFSISLNTFKKSENYSRALIYARSLMDAAYALPELSDTSESFTFENGFSGIRTVSLRSFLEEEKIKVYEAEGIRTDRANHRYRPLCRNRCNTPCSYETRISFTGKEYLEG
ncbi:MAG: hypothetical protein HY754_10485 [Nitrospirae bacterium]|nr:hypothetical protein [Nitrospirota bacterium]